MRTESSSTLGHWIRRFLLEHLTGERNLARNTQKSYRDTLSLALPFVAQETRTPIDRLCPEEMPAEMVRRFLAHLERDRGSSVATRNQRLAALHALAGFIGERAPEYLAWCRGIRAIPLKKAPRAFVLYLEKAEMDALLDAPNQATEQGRRDYAVLLFLYNTGARADEAAQVTVAELDFACAQSVTLRGKGGKVRTCPLWSLTAKTLAALVAGRRGGAPVFLNCRGQHMTRFGIYSLVHRLGRVAASVAPSLNGKRLCPHTIRHTTAVHLLRAGVDINTIRAWLGHVSLDTTNVYAEVDLTLKAKALAHCEIFANDHVALWRSRPEIMAFLKSL
jgi:integrase/recombinase XerD